MLIFGYIPLFVLVVGCEGGARDCFALYALKDKEHSFNSELTDIDKNC